MGSRSVKFSCMERLMIDNAAHFSSVTKRKVSLSARPFVKWAGGKGQLLTELVARLPKRYEHYFEPFVGGGALFFALRPPRATLLDINKELINVYSVVRDNLSELLISLSTHVHDEKYFYGMRQADRAPEYFQWSQVQKASRFIYLNKTCYNGLYRVNSKGLFNVPFGDYKSPMICDVPNLTACNAVLQSCKVECGQFLHVESLANPGDFIYFDPPYAPITATSNFTGYVKGGFGSGHQEELRNLCKRLDQKGVKWMLSNSSAPLVLDLYKEYQVEFVSASRAINSKGTSRGKIHEVIVRNYD
jgi:DNA adenine methylase